MEVKPLLQQLIRFDTSNPPGREKDAVLFCKKLFDDIGADTRLLGQEERPNLVSFIKGRGEAEPIMLYGHIDVVPAVPQRWELPPFEGVEKDGFIWGRGAIDMKGPLAMMMSAVISLAREGALRRDVVFCITVDEENFSTYGAKYLVENHSELFKGLRYAISEFGGLPVRLFGRQCFLVQVCEKQVGRIRCKVHGKGGHGSIVSPLSAVSIAAEGIRMLCHSKAFPIKVQPVVKEMLSMLAEREGGPRALLLKLLSHPLFAALAIRLAKSIGSDAVSMFEAMVSNTANPTVVRAGEKFNVVPDVVELELDTRLLPSEKIDGVVERLRSIFQGKAEIEVLSFEENNRPADISRFTVLKSIIEKRKPDAVALPYMMTGVTDARFFSRIGIQTYGFTPMDLPAGFDPFGLVHNNNERVPVSALEFGVDCLKEAVQAL